MTPHDHEKKKARERRWYAANRARRLAANARWRKNNPDVQRAAEHKWRKDNPDKERERQRNYREAHPDKVRAKGTRRRARKAAAPQDSPGDLLAQEEILREQPCVVCGTKDGVEIDHVIALSRGGAHTIDNMQPLCRSCNARKGAKTMEEFLDLA